MSLIHEQLFNVRHYECDMYGHVNHVNYLRYMQEASFAATTMAGYGPAHCRAIGQAWVIHETDIEYLQSLQYGDTLRVTTWLAEMSRIRARRMYELRKVEGDELVARAHSEWALVNVANGQLMVIPPEIQAAFFPQGVPTTRARREPFPAAPPPPPGLFTLRRRVEWRDIDPAGHVNNAVYMAYMEDCAIQDAASRGWPVTRMMAEAGFAIVARRYRIEYRQPALLDDELEVATWISDIKRISAVRHFTVRRVTDGELLARAHTTWVWVDSATGKPVRIPAAFIGDFAANIVGALA